LTERRRNSWQFPDPCGQVDRIVPICQITSDGDCFKKSVASAALLREYGLQGRDVLSLQRSMAVVQPRSACIIVALSKLRAVISSDSVVILLPSDDRPQSSLIDFGIGLSQHIRAYHSAFKAPTSPFEMVVRCVMVPAQHVPFNCEDAKPAVATN